MRTVSQKIRGHFLLWLILRLPVAKKLEITLRRLFSGLNWVSNGENGKNPATLENGYRYLPGFLPKETVLKIKSDLKILPVYSEHETGARIVSRLLDTKNATTSIWSYQMKDLLMNKTIRRICCEDSVLHAVEHYLHLPACLVYLTCFWSFQSSEVPSGTQFFHRDRDGVTFVKLFIPLVNFSESLCTTFVPESLDSYRLRFHRRLRLSDAEVSARFAKSSWVTFRGKVGDCWMVDTDGLHKGGYSETEDRLLLVATFGVEAAHWADYVPRQILQSEELSIRERSVLRLFIA